MLDNYCAGFIAKSEENYKLYELLKEQNSFIEWQVVAIFYSALCYAKAYLYKKGIGINCINSHDSIKFYLGNETQAKQSNVLTPYLNLYRNSRDARYTNKKFNIARLENILKDYKTIIKFLKENYC